MKVMLLVLIMCVSTFSGLMSVQTDKLEHSFTQGFNSATSYEVVDLSEVVQAESLSSVTPFAHQASEHDGVCFFCAFQFAHLESPITVVGDARGSKYQIILREPINSLVLNELSRPPTRT